MLSGFQLNESQDSSTTWEREAEQMHAHDGVGVSGGDMQLPSMPHLRARVARAPITHAPGGDNRRQAKQPPLEGDRPSSDIDDTAIDDDDNHDDNRATR